MKININKPSQLLSHLLLENEDVATAVASTPSFTEDGEINCTVQFNGVECPAEVLEETLAHFVKFIEAEVNLDEFDQKVEKRARELLKEHADDALEKLGNLTAKLEDIDSVIKPHWER